MRMIGICALVLLILLIFIVETASFNIFLCISAGLLAVSIFDMDLKMLGLSAIWGAAGGLFAIASKINRFITECADELDNQEVTGAKKED